MSATDWIIDVLLVAIVLRQLTPRPLTARSVVLPLVIVAFAGSEYLKGFPTHGNDVLMDVVLVAVGAAFGVTSGLTTRVWRTEQGNVMCRAGIVAAATWVLGMGSRLAFEIWANTSSGQLSLYHFAQHHDLSTTPLSQLAQAYATAFVLMAFAQVLLRVGIMQVRRLRFERFAQSPVASLG